MRRIGFFVVMVLFGTVHSWWGSRSSRSRCCSPRPRPGRCSAFAATIKTDNMFAILYRFVIIPLTLFAGVFFPVDQMPAGSPLDRLHLAVVARRRALPRRDAWDRDDSPARRPLWIHRGLGRHRVRLRMPALREEAGGLMVTT